jgi:hypothetical protein
MLMVEGLVHVVDEGEAVTVTAETVLYVGYVVLPYGYWVYGYDVPG